MKNYYKEIIILILQLMTFYLLPIIALNISKDAIVLAILFSPLIIFALSITLGIISKIKIKYIYPIIVAVIYIPSVFIIYDDSALIYTIFHFIASVLGIGIVKLFNR